MQPWFRWKFVKDLDAPPLMEERDRIVETLKQLYSKVLPKVGGVVVGMERVCSEGLTAGGFLAPCLWVEWQEGWQDYFWVWGGGRYLYVKGKVLRKFGMEGHKAMHALVCELLHGPYKRTEKVMEDGKEVEKPVVKVVMHACGEGALRDREGKWTCCILPWHLQWGVVQDNVDGSVKKRKKNVKERGDRMEKLNDKRWGPR